MTQLEPATLGALAALGSSATWAMGSVVYSRFSARYSGFAVNFARAWIALPIFVMAAFWMAGGFEAGIREFAGIGKQALGWMSLSILASYGVGDVLFLRSTTLIGVPGALAIASAYPLWMALVEVAQGHPLGLSRWGGLALTLAGLITVILNIPVPPRRNEERSARLTTLGVLLAVATSFCWALNGYSVSKGMAGLSTPVGNTIRMLIAMGLGVGLGRIFAPRTPILIRWSELKPYLWLFALESFGGSYFYLTAYAKAPLVIAATLSSLAPVLSVPVAWALRLEKFSPWRTVGILGVILGLWFLVIGR